jgi:hypothetical protein
VTVYSPRRSTNLATAGRRLGALYLSATAYAILGNAPAAGATAAASSP